MTDLPSVIAQIESSGNAHAQRFESLMLARWLAGSMSAAQRDAVARVRQIHRCDEDTGQQIACTSYGLYQILGETLWGDLGLATDNVDFMGNLALQRSAFDMFCTRRGIAFDVEEMTGPDAAATAKRQLFSLRYNGPGDPDAYAAKIAETIARLSAPQETGA